MGLFDFLKKGSDFVEDTKPISEACTTDWGYEFPAGYEFKPDHVRSRQELLHDFKQLMLKHFGDYRVYYQVPTSELDRSAHPACAPISFLLEKDGCYRLAVFIVSDSTYRSRNMMGTHEVLDAHDIPYINFWEEYANDDDYVVARIRYYLS